MSGDRERLLARLRAEPAGADGEEGDNGDSGDSGERGEGDLAARVQAALDEEGARVTLADGSTLSLDDAEDALTRREERGAHPALRESIDAALAPFRQLMLYRSDVDGEPFLVETRALRDAAREALASLAGEALASPAALARALDLPGFSDPTALLTAARDAARPTAPVTRFRAPRAMAGTATAHGFAHPAAPMERFARHAAVVEGGAVALALSVGRGRDFGRAMALGLLSAPVRRVSGLGRGEAERVGRIAAAALVLRVRAGSGCAWDAGARRDVLAQALGGDPGRAADVLMRAPFAAGEGYAERAGAWQRAAGIAVSLRDAFDEAFPLQPEAWRAEMEGQAGGWDRWVGPWL